MAGGKASPRQKMINMMYLVLTALLALNVSKEILKSFFQVEVSFLNAGKNIDTKNEKLIAALKNEEQNRPEEVRPFREKAEQVVKISKEFDKYVEDIKKYLIEATGGRKPGEHGEEMGELLSPDNIEKHANYFMLQGKGEELQKKINETRTKMMSFIADADIRKRMETNSNFRAENDPKKKPQTWYSEYFEHSPLAGVIALLTKIQNDNKNAEAEVLEQLTKDIDASKISFDQVIPIIVTPSSAVMVGQKYEADIILGAYNSKQNNEVLVNGSPVVSKDGKAHFEAVASRDGEFAYKGVIKVAGKNGVEPIPFEGKYQAFTPGATISATAMNVFYVGLDNPVSVSVPGVQPSDVTVSLSGPGQLVKKTGTDFIYKLGTMGAVRKVTLSVTAKMRDGSSRNMGTKEYRLKNVPTPEPRLGGLVSGDYAKAQISNQTRVLAYLGDFAFEGVNFTVTKYTFFYAPRRGEMKVENGNGDVVTPSIKAIMNSARAGDKIIFDAIEAQGPSGKKKLSPIVLGVK